MKNGDSFDHVKLDDFLFHSSIITKVRYFISTNHMIFIRKHTGKNKKIERINLGEFNNIVQYVSYA
jgi:hypothetical protein